MLEKIRSSSVASCTRRLRSFSSSGLFRVSSSLSQYAVSFASFRRSYSQLEILLAQCLVGFDLIGADRSRRTHHLLAVLKVAHRPRQAPNKGSYRLREFKG